MTAAAEVRLDLHEGISDAARATGGCPRWPTAMRLHSSAGHLVPGRCRATNKCDYCARLAAVEFSEMLALDALNGDAPRVWCVLTTRSANPDPAAFYAARQLVMRAVKRRWPGAEYVCVVEFTTGYGPRSGGTRRPHWNLLLKGVPVEDAPELERIVTEAWCRNVDASPRAQFVGAVDEVGGLMRYLALHFLKESQRPPKGWRGHRTTTSRGYWNEGAAWRARRTAQASLRLKRELHRAEQEGLEGAEALAVAEARVFTASLVRWQCVALTIDRETGEIRRAVGTDGQEPRVMRVDRAARRVADVEQLAALGVDDALQELLVEPLAGYVEPPQLVMRIPRKGDESSPCKRSEPYVVSPA